MPRQTQRTSGIKRGVGQDAARQKDVPGMEGQPVRAKVPSYPPPAREASQSSSKVGVQKNAPDAFSKGVNICKSGSKTKRKA